MEIISVLGGQRGDVSASVSAQGTMPRFGSGGSALTAPSVDVRSAQSHQFVSVLPTQMDWFGRPLDVSVHGQSLQRGVLGGGLGYWQRVVPRVAKERSAQELGSAQTGERGRAAEMADSGARAEVATNRFPYVSLIRVMLDRDQVASARTLLSVAIAERIGDTELRKIAAVLVAPTSVKKLFRDRDRSAEYGWLTLHSTEYRGRWVALVGDELVAAAGSLKELLLSLQTSGRKGDALIHRVV